MSEDILNLLERLQKIDQSGFNENRASIESELDRLGDIKGIELGDIWREEIKSGDIPDSKLDVIDDIMASRFGSEYKKYIKGEAIGESKKRPGYTKGDTSKEGNRETVPGTMKSIEEPDVCPDTQSLEPGDKEPDKKKQDTMTKPTDKELQQLVDKKVDEDISTMFAEDKVDVLQQKVDRLKIQAKDLESQQRGTRKSTRGYVLQKFYSKIDDYEKQIAVIKNKLGESVQELVGEIPGISVFDQKVLKWAIEKDVISNKFPSYQIMMQGIADHPGSQKIDPRSVDFNKVATSTDVEGMYLKNILLPKAKKAFKNSYSEDKSWFERKQLYLCNNCSKTFRNDINECTNCQSISVQKLGVRVDEEFKSKWSKWKVSFQQRDAVHQGRLRKNYMIVRASNEDMAVEKVKRAYGPVKILTIDIEESKLSEQEEDKGYTVVASGIVDKNTADEMAREKKGTVIQDESDKEKFSVIVKESHSDEDIRNMKTPEQIAKLKDKYAKQKFGSNRSYADLNSDEKKLVDNYFKKSIVKENRLETQKTRLEKQMKTLDVKYKKDMDRIGTAIDNINQELKSEKEEKRNHTRVNEKFDYAKLRALILVMLNDPHVNDEKIFRVLGRSGYDRQTIQHVLDSMRKIPKNVGPLENKNG